MSKWTVYILRCADNSLYTGITTDVARRVQEHNAGRKNAASYTRGRRPVTLIYQEQAADRASATRREMEIKRLDRWQKQQLVNMHG